MCDCQAAIEELRNRVELLERHLAGLATELVTERLVVGDVAAAHLVAEERDKVFELRVRADDAEVLIFAAGGSGVLPVGAGMQLRFDGDEVAALEHWSDGLPPLEASGAR